jgi:hypothetical protein
MEHVLFNSSVKTKIGLKIDPKWKESQITKKISVSAPQSASCLWRRPSNSWQHSRSQKKLHADSSGSC